MKMKRYRVNVRETSLQPHTEAIYKSRGLHDVFNKGEIPLIVKSAKSPLIKSPVCAKIILFLTEYFQKCTYNKTININTNLLAQFLP